MKAPVVHALLAVGLFLPPACLHSAEAQTNAPPPLTTVAVLRWVAAEPPPLPPEDQHWLRTFTGLVGRELGFVAVVFG